MKSLKYLVLMLKDTSYYIAIGNNDFLEGSIGKNTF